MGKIENIKQTTCPICDRAMARSDYDPGDDGIYMYCINMHYVDHNGYLDFCPEWGISKRYIGPRTKIHGKVEPVKIPLDAR